MGAVIRDAHYLLAQARSLCLRSPYGFRPWKWHELLRLIDRITRQPSDHGAFYLDFMEGMRDLVDSEEEDHILRRFAEQTLAVEARVHADDKEARDHLTHVTQVFLVGWLILNGCRRFAFAPAEWRPYDWPSDPTERFCRLNRSWMFASLLHDCAYSVQKAPFGRAHEAVVRGLFGAIYRPGTSGGVDAAELSKQVSALWRQRTRWIFPGELGAAAPPAAAAIKHEEQYTSGDHAFVGATALYNATDGLREGDLAEVLRPAAVAIACHNNQYLVNVNEHAESPVNRWFRVDLWEEPLSALLHLCDEIQEWSRERTDEILGHREGRFVCRYEATEVTYLDVNDSAGVAVDARLLRRLHPEDRSVRHRLVRDQECRIADTARRFRVLFTPRTAPADFRLHVRLEQTVDDLRCGNALTVAWPEPPRGLLQLIHDEWIKSARPELRLERAAVTVEASASPPSAGASGVVEGDQAEMAIQRGSTIGVRAVIIAAGGAGKSTLLQALARIQTLSGIPVQARYVDQLPDQPSDIADEVVRLRKSDPTREILLLIDHLDRLEEDEYGQFWIDQLAHMPSTPWLHVMLACRPEEFDGSLGAALVERYKRCTLRGPNAPFVGGETDAEGRARAFAIEAGLKGSPPAEIQRLAALAFGMQQRRRLELPVGTVLSPDRTQYRGRRLLVDCPDGTKRFMHDAIQDYLSAFHIVSALAKEEPGGEGLRAWVRSLARLPRDVPRLLFDFLASDGWLMTRSGRKRAAEALSRGLFQDRTTEYWLHDTGRIEQARHAIQEFRLRHSTYRRVRMSSAMLLGFAAHRRSRRANLADRAKRDEELGTIEECVSSLVESAREAELVLQEDRPNRQDEADLRLHLAIVADHVVAALASVAAYAAVRDEAWILARDAVGKLGWAKEAPALTPGWLGGLLAAVARGASHEEHVRLLERVFNDTAALVQNQPGGPTWLDSHLNSTAQHLSSAFNEQARKQTKPSDRLKSSMGWQLRCLSRTERMARWTRNEEQPQPYHGFLDLPHAYSHVAWQKTNLFQIHLFSAAWSDRTRDSVAGVIEAHGAQEDAWKLAKNVLGPASRLSHWFRHALPMLAVGGALQALVEDGGKAVSQHIAKEVLQGKAKALFEEYQRIGEPHPRFLERDSVEGVIEYYDDWFENTPTLLADLARTMRT